jgi:hypothetical protein
MELLVALQPITAKSGQVIKPGRILRARDPKRLVVAGKARRLTHKENERIFGAYVKEAETVLGNPVPATEEKPARPNKETCRYVQGRLI